MLSKLILVYYTKMGYRSILKMWWMLITILPLKATAAPYNASQENNGNNTLDYGMNYYEFPVGLFLNDTYNDTYGVGFVPYYIGFIPDYFGYYAYPEFDAYYDQVDETSTKNLNTTSRSTERYARGLKKPKSKRPGRMTRSVSKTTVVKHLCMRNLLNVTNIFQKVRYIYDCKDKDVKHFACLNTGGFVKPCSVLKGEKHEQVPLCIKKESHSNVVTTCNSPKSQYFCFTFPRDLNRLVICNERSLRVCFNGNLTNCENPVKKQVLLPFTTRQKDQNHEKKNLPSPVAIHHKHRKHEKKRVQREIQKPRKHKERKPDVNCNNCEVDVKVEFDEFTNNAPRVLIKVSKLDPLDKLMDVLDSNFET